VWARLVVWCVFVWAGVATDASLCGLVATALAVQRFSSFVSFVLVFVRARVATHSRIIACISPCFCHETAQVHGLKTDVTVFKLKYFVHTSYILRKRKIG